MEHLSYTFTFLLSVQVLGFNVALAAAIGRSSHATPTITKTIYHTGIRRLYTSKSDASRAQRPTTSKLPLTGMPVIISDQNVEDVFITRNTRRGHIPNAEPDRASDKSANLYNLRIDLTSEGSISVYMPHIIASDFCERSVAAGSEASGKPELRLAVHDFTKIISIPVGKEDANNLCSQYLKAEGIAAPISDESAGKQKPPDLGLVSTMGELSSPKDPLGTLTRSPDPTLSRDQDSVKTPKPSPSTKLTSSSTRIRKMADESNDTLEASETIRRKSPNVTYPDSPAATRESELDFGAEMEMRLSDTANIDSDTGPSRSEKTLTSAPHAYPKTKTKQINLSNLMSPAPIDSSETRYRPGIAHEVEGQVISTAASQETWEHDSVYELASFTTLRLPDLIPGNDESTALEELDISRGHEHSKTLQRTSLKVSADFPDYETSTMASSIIPDAAMEIQELTVSSTNTWFDYINRYLETAVAPSESDLTASLLEATGGSENGAAGKMRAIATKGSLHAREDHSPKPTASSLDSWYDYTNDFMGTARPTSSLEMSWVTGIANSQLTANVGNKRLKPTSIVWLRAIPVKSASVLGVNIKKTTDEKQEQERNDYFNIGFGENDRITETVSAEMEAAYLVNTELPHEQHIDIEKDEGNGIEDEVLEEYFEPDYNNVTNEEIAVDEDEYGFTNEDESEVSLGDGTREYAYEQDESEEDETSSKGHGGNHADPYEEGDFSGREGNTNLGYDQSCQQSILLDQIA